MPFTQDNEHLSRIETMLLKEMNGEGKIMVRSLDKIHAQTGLNYMILSEIAVRLQERNIELTGY
jgi:hypothetical protein